MPAVGTWPGSLCTTCTGLCAQLVVLTPGQRDTGQRQRSTAGPPASRGLPRRPRIGPLVTTGISGVRDRTRQVVRGATLEALRLLGIRTVICQSIIVHV